MPLRLEGLVSGYVELKAPDVAGATVLELPLGSIKPALVKIASQSFSAVSAVNINGCFSSEYDNYRVMVLVRSASGGTQARLKLRSGVVNSDTLYRYTNIRGAFNGATLGNDYSTGVTEAAFYLFASASGGQATVDLMSPFLVEKTYISGASSDGTATGPGRVLAGFHDSAASYDGLALVMESGTLTGSITVYGYTK